MSDKAKVLVTGGLGFIGSSLVKKLEKEGYQVWVCDLDHHTRERYFRCDISKFRQMKAVFEEHDFEYVYHAAAEYGRWNGEAYYENLWITNAVGTKHLLQLQKRHKFRMIFFGSAEVYGDFSGTMSEDVMGRVAIRQMNDYAISKWVNEQQIMNSQEMYATESVIIRLFNVYGPGEHYTPFRGFIPRFIYLALHNRPYTVYLDHKRTLEYIDDICRTLVNIPEKFKPGEVYNLGGETQFDVKFISDLILKSLGKDDSKVTYEESENFTTRIKTPDSSKAKRDLGFKLKVSIEEGIRRTVKWFKKVY
jgi:dTDP-glucose 4,6-dehydratase